MIFYNRLLLYAGAHKRWRVGHKFSSEQKVNASACSFSMLELPPLLFPRLYKSLVTV